MALVKLPIVSFPQPQTKAVKLLPKLYFVHLAGLPLGPNLIYFLNVSHPPFFVEEWQEMTPVLLRPSRKLLRACPYPSKSLSPLVHATFPNSVCDSLDPSPCEGVKRFLCSELRKGALRPRILRFLSTHRLTLVGSRSASSWPSKLVLVGDSQEEPSGRRYLAAQPFFTDQDELFFVAPDDAIHYGGQFHSAPGTFLVLFSGVSRKRACEAPCLYVMP